MFKERTHRQRYQWMFDFGSSRKQPTGKFVPISSGHDMHVYCKRGKRETFRSEGAARCSCVRFLSELMPSQPWVAYRSAATPVATYRKVRINNPRQRLLFKRSRNTSRTAMRGAEALVAEYVYSMFDPGFFRLCYAAHCRLPMTSDPRRLSHTSLGMARSHNRLTSYGPPWPMTSTYNRLAPMLGDLPFSGMVQLACPVGWVVGGGKEGANQTTHMRPHIFTFLNRYCSSPIRFR